MNFFKLKENNTSVLTEFLAGLTTFMTMAYIIAVNPNILSNAFGIEYEGALFTATAIATIVSTLIMAFYARYPFAFAPGMGLNAFFAFTVAAAFGWRIALFIVFVEGILFIILSIFKFRERILDTIPNNIKYSIGAGIGLFIIYIGFYNAYFIVPGPALTSLGNIDITVVLFMIGSILTIVFLVKKIKGAIFLGIIATYILALISEFLGLYQVGIHGPSLIPSGIASLPPSIADINIFSYFPEVFDSESPYSFSALLTDGLGNWNWDAILNFITILFALFFVDVFDTVGTVIGVSEKAGFLDKNGKLPRSRQAFLSDAIGTLVGAGVGTSTTTTYIESATGVAEGGKTGLTAVFTALFFFIAMFFWPIFSVIPNFVTAPALVAVGLFMASSVVKIDFNDFSEGFPAFLTLILMAFTFSIADGILFGILSYTAIKILTGKYKEVSITMYILSLFLSIVLIFAL